MWETIELRELRVFLTLADELHFGRTAERLHLTRSRVSQTLSELEHKVGDQLVHRTSRRVALTPAGERFRAEAGAAYDQLVRVLERRHAAAHNLEGVLRLGLLSGPSAGPHLLRICEVFETLHPACTAQVSELQFDDPFGQLRHGDVDVMTSWLPLEQADLVIGPILHRDRRVLALARDHPLASAKQVSIEDLADYHVAPQETLPQEMLDAFVPSVTPSGRPIPRLDAPASRGWAGHAALVARGKIVHPTVSSLEAHWGHPDIRYVPIVDMPPLTAALVWRRRASDPRLREFVRVARDVLRAVQPS